MGILIAATVFCGFLSISNAHFTTGHLLVNGTDTGLWKHVLYEQSSKYAESANKSFLVKSPFSVIRPQTAVSRLMSTSVKLSPNMPRISSPKT